MEKLEPTNKAIEEAIKNPNGWVYVIDEAFEGTDDIPPEAIKGAWKVNKKGKIIGEFIPNPNYKDLNSIL